MGRTVTMVLLLAAVGCGSQPVPAVETVAATPPATATEPEAGGGAKPEEPDAAPPAPPDPPEPLPPEPFHRAGAGCRPMTASREGTPLPVATNQAELERLVGCDPRITVDWQTEHIALVFLEGTNQRFMFDGVTTNQGVAVIAVHIRGYVAGAARHDQQLWLVRVPAAATRVEVKLRGSRERWVGPMPS